MLSRWSSGARRELPLGRDPVGHFLPWIIGFLVYVAAIGAIALLLFGGTLADWDRSLTSSLTLEIPADASAARIEMTVALLRQTPGIAAVRLLEPAETARLLEPWLGTAAPIDTLPLPRLVDLRIDPAAAVDFATLEQRLESIAPGARLDDHRLWLGRLRAFAARIETVITAVVGAAVLLLVLLAAVAARTGFALHRAQIELLRLLGATDRDITRQFQRQALWLALIGGCGGAIAAAATLVALARAGRAVALPLPFVARGLADWRLWALLIAAVPAAGLVATATARAAIGRRLARLP